MSLGDNRNSMTHHHDNAPANFNRAFAIGIALNAVFVAIEAFYGWRRPATRTLPARRGSAARPDSVAAMAI